MSSCVSASSTELLAVLTEAMLGHWAEVLFEAGKCSCCPPCCVAQKSLRPQRKLDEGTDLMGNSPTTYLYPLPSPPQPLLVLFMLCHYFPGWSPHLFRAVLGRAIYRVQQQALLFKSLHQMCRESSSGGCQHFVIVLVFFFSCWLGFGHTTFTGWGGCF